MLKKIIILFCIFSQIFGSGGQSAQVDSQAKLKPVEETLITQTKKSEAGTSTVLDVVTSTKPIQDIITGYMSCWGYDKDILYTSILGTTIEGESEGKNQLITHAYSPDGKYLLFIEDEFEYQIVLYDSVLGDMKEKFKLEREGSYPLQIRYSIDLNYVALFGCYDIKIYDANTFTLIKKIDIPKNIPKIYDVQFYTNLSYLIVAMRNDEDTKCLYYCNWRDEKPQWITSEMGPDNNATIHKVLVSPSGKHVVESRLRTGSFFVWDRVTRDTIASHMICNNVTSDLQTMAYSPSGVYFAAASADQDFVYIYDANTYSELAKIEFDNLNTTSHYKLIGHCCDLAFSPNDKYLAFATLDKVYIYDIKNKKIIFTHSVGEGSRVQSLAYNPNGTSITACLNDRISILEAPTLE